MGMGVYSQTPSLKADTPTAGSLRMLTTREEEEEEETEIPRRRKGWSTQDNSVIDYHLK